MEQAYTGTKPSKPVEEEIRERRVLEAINEVELMGGGYAGYADMMEAPAWHVQRTRLVLLGKRQAEQKQAEEAEAEAKKGGSGSGSGSSGGGSGRNTRVSAYYPE